MHEDELYIHIQQITGKILSGLTHEMKNHLAVINESNGLLEDYLSLGYAREPEGEEKLLGICNKMSERVALASDMMQVLNSYAHRADSHSATIDIQIFMEELITLVERFARLKNIELAPAPVTTASSLETAPALLGYIVHVILFHIIELKTGEEEKKITLSFEEKDADTTLLFTMNFALVNKDTNLFHSGSEEDQYLQYAMKKIGITLNLLEETENSTRIKLNL